MAILDILIELIDTGRMTSIIEFLLAMARALRRNYATSLIKFPIDIVNTVLQP